MTRHIEIRREAKKLIGASGKACSGKYISGQSLVGIVITIVMLFIFAPSALAETLESPSYKFGESTLGQSGLPNSSSSNYQGSSSVGDIGVGRSDSTNFQFGGGSQTTNDPRLEVSVSGGVTLGTLDPGTATMGTATFTVINYTSYGYQVLISGDPPTSGSHAITPIASPDTSAVGFEQFGINLVANTDPQSIGANPVNDPGFGFGVVDADYNTPNNYMYSNGDVIASAPQSSGQTDYTISYLVNVSPLTPGGQYTAGQTVVVVGTY